VISNSKYGRSRARCNAFILCAGQCHHGRNRRKNCWTGWQFRCNEPHRVRADFSPRVNKPGVSHPLAHSANGWEITKPARQMASESCEVKKRPQFRLGSSGRATNVRDRRSNPCQSVNLSRLAAAIGVAAQAGDLRSVPYALAMRAAILPLFGSRAGAGRIRAFLGVCHSPPSPVYKEPFFSRANCRLDAETCAKG
jgi:hypothetical protein